MGSASRARVACQWKAKPRISSTKPVVADSVTVSVVSRAPGARARRVARLDDRDLAERRVAACARWRARGCRRPARFRARRRWRRGWSAAASAPRTSSRRRPIGAAGGGRGGDDHAVGIGEQDAPADGGGAGRQRALEQLLQPRRRVGGVAPRGCCRRSATRSATSSMSSMASAIAWRRWSSTCTTAPTPMVSRKAMMSAGTARRSAGSAVSRRRYAGLAIDCARPLMESGSCGRTRRFGARHARPPFGLSPDTRDRKDVPHLSRITCDWNRWALICRESESQLFKINVTAQNSAVRAQGVICESCKPRIRRWTAGISGVGQRALRRCRRRRATARARPRCAAAPLRALARRPASSARQLLNAVISRAATCGFFGSSASTLSATKSKPAPSARLNWVWLPARTRRSARARGWDWPSRRPDARSARARGRACRLRDHGLQREPFVDDQRIVAIALRRSRRARAARSGTSCSDSVASAAMRSVMLSAASYCRAAQRDRLRLRRSPPADRGRRSSARGGRRWRRRASRGRRSAMRS